MADLRWSAAWAEVVGADGFLVSDLLGRVGPALTDEQAAQLKTADYDLRRAAEVAARLLRPTIDTNALTSAWACAAQSAGRVIDAIAPFDAERSGGDRWYRWAAARRALVNVCTGLVVRRFDPDAAAPLLATWESVMGPLPPVAELDTEAPGLRCYACGQHSGVSWVTAAEAARYAQHLETGMRYDVQWAREDRDKAQAMLREFTRSHLSPDAVRGHLTIAMNGTTGISARARAHLEKEFGITRSG